MIINEDMKFSNLIYKICELKSIQDYLNKQITLRPSPSKKSIFLFLILTLFYLQATYSMDRVYDLMAKILNGNNFVIITQQYKRMKFSCSIHKLIIKFLSMFLGSDSGVWSLDFPLSNNFKFLRFKILKLFKSHSSTKVFYTSCFLWNVWF